MVRERTRVAVVTGAAGGVGGRLVRSRAAQGWKVFAVVRTSEQADELSVIEGVDARTLDLLDSASLTAGARDLVAHDAPADAHLTNVDLRPRQEVCAKFTV